MRHKHFKLYLAYVDPLKQTPPRKTHLNWNCQPIFKHIINICKAAIVLGQYISEDEQTVGCKGRHPDIIRINFKKEGDGFQCDSICSDGYTYKFYFRNQPAPKKYLDKNLAPLHTRPMALFDQLPSKHYKCGMDNLYVSAKVIR